MLLLTPWVVIGACLPDLSARDYVVAFGSGSSGSSGAPLTSMGTEGASDGGIAGVPGECGDGVVDPGEECDDGGESAECNANCSRAKCGDGIANATAGEECDGTQFLGASCQASGYAAGTVACGTQCTVDETACSILGFSAIRWFDFAWPAHPEASHYRLWESVDGEEPFVLVEDGIGGQSVSYERSLHLHQHSRYRLDACSAAEPCETWKEAKVDGAVEKAVGYFKASNTDPLDNFQAVALSEDGRTLAVGAWNESSDARGIDGEQNNNASPSSGAVYVFIEDGPGQWRQQAYIKASNPNTQDWFGILLVLSNSGDTLAVAAAREDSSAVGVNGDQSNNDAIDSGATYIFARTRDRWQQQAYIKALNTEADDGGDAGYSIALSGDGSTLAIGAHGEDSSATGIDGPMNDNGAHDSGAVYLYRRENNVWAEEAYVKATNTDPGDRFGTVSLNDDGTMLAVGAELERSGGESHDNSVSSAGAVYLYARDEKSHWSPADYVKAPNVVLADHFGRNVEFSGDGRMLAVSGHGDVIFYMCDVIGGCVYSNQLESETFSMVLSGDGEILAVREWYKDGIKVFTSQDRVDWQSRARLTAFSSNDNVDFDRFALSYDGTVLAVGSYESSGARGIGGDQANNHAMNAGAVFLF